VNIDYLAPPSLNPLGLEIRYRQLGQKTLKLLNQSLFATVDVWLTNRAVMQTLNGQFRNKSYPTDVLSFPAGEVASFNKSLPRHLGQIVICYPIAKSQAQRYHHPIHREFSFLFVHGLLHLLGYNHDTPTEEKEMLRLQDIILGKRVSHE
jgi:probable rRNA maturation factor